ncbi:MAG: sucrose phosphorylase [Reichenbachiella sp.]|uniref:sucrose phosphorylase n=1 Tax=Reichenbachiella sp. TaxID=2184521 RepID=UPI003262D420
MKNKVQLIAYIDRFGKKGIAEFHAFLSDHLKDHFEGGIHLLPFYNTIDGADAGYDPKDHTQVDPRLGDWEDIKKLSDEFDLMADLIVNHISSDSREFQDVKMHGHNSQYFDLFLTKEKVFPKGASESLIKKIYRPRPNLPFTTIKVGQDEEYDFWTTFTSDQIDIDVLHQKGSAYISQILKTFSLNGIKSIRLDAAGYAIKKPETSCFMIPETYDFIGEFSSKARAMGIDVLVEIHTHYKHQIEIASKVDYVYDFALPPLILHTIAKKSGTQLKNWLEISPRNCVTVLDTHDGIGIVDIAKQDDNPGLLSDEEVDYLVESIHKNSNNTSRIASGEGGSNLDIYQVNCSFYEALGKNSTHYLIARAIQFFCPGIPQVYYGGFLAAANDLKLLGTTKVGRDINRPYLEFDEVLQMLESSVVKDLSKLIKFRNTHPSFGGNFSVLPTSDDQIKLRWDLNDEWSELNIDLLKSNFEINYSMQEVESLLIF